MKKVVKYYLLLSALILLSSCGTKDYLGFEKEKVRLKGKRVSVLEEKDIKKPFSSNSLTEVLLDAPIMISNWPQSNNSPSHIAINHLSDTKLDKIKFLVAGKGEDKKSKILSQPVVDQGFMFFIDAKSNVISFSLKDKKIKWKKNISIDNEKNHDIGGGVVIYKKNILVNSPYGQIINLDMESGKEIWKVNVDSPIRSSPTIYDNKLFSVTVSNKLYVLNLEDGNLLWQHQGIFNNTTLMNSPKVAVDENIVIVPYSNGDFFALNVNNGKEVWRSSFVDLSIKETTNAFFDIDANPVIKKDIVIMTSAIGKLLVLNKKTGNKIWTRDITSTQTPTVNGNSIFVINENKELYCLNLIDGGSRWSISIEEDFSKKNRFIWMSPLLINNQLLLVGGDKKMITLDASNGKIENIKNLSSFPASSPLVVNQKLYLMLRNGDIIQIE